MVYSTEHRVFLVETSTKKSSYKICRHKFHQKFPDVNVPSKSMIERLVKKFHSTGSVLNKKKNRKRSVLTAEKLDETGASLESSPRKSLTQLAVQYGMSLGSAHTAKRLLKFRFSGTKLAVVSAYM
jgi:ERCC4-type nuclease